MKNNSLVSIVVPVYNPGAYLLECIESIVSQSYGEIEVILIDDGSVDGSAVECDKIASTDSRVRVIHQQNKGVSSTRNKGVELSSGEFICFVDADDVIDKNFVKALVGCFDRDDIQMACTGISRHVALDNNDIFTKQYLTTVEYSEGIFYGDLTYGWGVTNKLFRLDTLRSLGKPFNESVKIGEDLRLVVDLLGQSGVVAVIQEPLYGYRINNEGAMHKSGSAAMFELIDSSKYAANSVVGNKVSEGAVDALLFRNAIYCAALTYSKRGELQSGYEKCMSLVRSTRWKVIFNTRTSMNMKIKAIFTVFSGISIVSRLTR